MQIAAIEKVFNKSKDALKVRESEWIKEFGTLVPSHEKVFMNNCQNAEEYSN